jgi:hypothetical protein
MDPLPNNQDTTRQPAMMSPTNAGVGRGEMVLDTRLVLDSHEDPLQFSPVRKWIYTVIGKYAVHRSLQRCAFGVDD